jgi:hypothetical protein
MENDELKTLFCQGYSNASSCVYICILLTHKKFLTFQSDVAELCRFGVIPVIVHGGGPQIAKMLKSLNVESSFVDGLRVTDEVHLYCGFSSRGIGNHIF